MKKDRLTRIQMKYLRTWLNLQGKQRSLAAAALKQNVSRTAVQKVLASIVERGILDDKYELTPRGEDYYAWFNLRFQAIARWYMLNNIPVEEAEETAEILVLDAPPVVADMMMNKSLICSICHMSAFETEGKIQFQGVDLKKSLPEGMYTVGVEFRKLGNEEELSMADTAFEKPGKLLVTGDHSEIVLKRRRISHISGIDDAEVSGKMRTLEYTVGGKIRKPKVEAEEVHISTEDMTWGCSGVDGVLTGKLKMAFTCTAGMHMPKAEAMMCIRIVEREI